MRPFRYSRARILAGCCVVLAISGCIGGTDSVTGVQAFAGSGAAAPGGGVDTRLVGRWSRTTLLDDNSGFLQSSQLIWEFNADGGARRIIITTNLTLGLVATEIVPALWRASGGAVEITLLPPGGGTLNYQYSAGLSSLSLGPFVLERLS